MGTGGQSKPGDDVDIYKIALHAEIFQAVETARLFDDLQFVSFL